MDITQFPPPPVDESWYFYCYRAGLGGVLFEDILGYANRVGKEIRGKDYDNWNRGYSKNKDPFHISDARLPMSLTTLDSFPEFERGYREPIDCYIPCNSNCKPLVKWSQVRCTEAQAKAYRYCTILGKNLKGLRTVVIDVDGDHDGMPDWDVINYWTRFIGYTSARVKYDQLNRPVSFHLEFQTNKIIPTMHFPKVDLLGNANNQVQYLKPNKVYNHLPKADLDDYVWKELQSYVQGRNVHARLDRANG